MDIDADGDGWPASVDCDDTLIAIYPGADVQPGSLCLGFDVDCDGLLEGEEDFDQDGQTWCEFDCDDHDAARWRGAPDPIDGIDQNCDSTDGVGETPTLLQNGELSAWALGHTMLSADVNGDGCDDLVFTESGFTTSTPVTGIGFATGHLHAWLGCTEPQEVRTYTNPPGSGSNGVGKFLARAATSAQDRVLAITTWTPGFTGAAQLIDFTTDPPGLLRELQGEVGGEIFRGTVLHREQPEMLLLAMDSFGSGPARGWTLTDSTLPTWSEPDRLWWDRMDDIHYGWGPVPYDRTGDGYEELLTSSAAGIPMNALAGELHVLTGPHQVTETWHGDITMGPLFGTQVFPAPDLPHPGDRGMLAGGELLLDSGALFLLPPLGPGEYTLDDAGPMFIGEFLDEWFGVDAAVGDVNADGFVDVIIGAPYSPSAIDGRVGEPGKVYVFLGPIDDPVLSRSEARVFTGPQPAGQFGWSVELADLDGDGTPEIYVGSPSHWSAEPVTYGRFGALFRIDL